MVGFCLELLLRFFRPGPQSSIPARLHLHKDSAFGYSHDWNCRERQSQCSSQAHRCSPVPWVCLSRKNTWHGFRNNAVNMRLSRVEFLILWQSCDKFIRKEYLSKRWSTLLGCEWGAFTVVLFQGICFDRGGFILFFQFDQILLYRHQKGTVQISGINISIFPFDNAFVIFP